MVKEWSGGFHTFSKEYGVIGAHLPHMNVRCSLANRHAHSALGGPTLIVWHSIAMRMLRWLPFFAASSVR